MKSNPLSTRFVEPGRLAWYATDEAHTLAALAKRFTDVLQLRAAIVGPHGSGKSTLLEHLVPSIGTIVLKRAAYESSAVTSVTQLTDSSRLRVVWLKMRGRSASSKLLKDCRHEWLRRDSLLVIDGYEQLSWLARARALMSTKSSNAGLLLTSHRTTALPTLVRTAVDEVLALQLLDQLLPETLPQREQLMNASRLRELLASHHGNLRETFMQLYDDLEK